MEQLIADASSTDNKLWERCNDLVISWIMYNFDDNFATSVLFLKTTREIWRDLENRFGYTYITQVFTLEQRLSEMKQGQLYVSKFYTQSKPAWDSLDDADPFPNCTCNKCTCELAGNYKKLQHNHRVLQFLMKLNDKRRVDGATFFQSTRRPINNFHKQNLANVVAPKRFNQKPGSSYYCSYRKVAGHSLERCFKVYGYPLGFKLKDKKFAAISQANVEDNPPASTHVSM
ncbi:uncharacterized protein LOC141684717 [Apium graveolens]|uniref:uncharacterized protein LOC141684717 n=1 Tax=Apium graveolens TaxID=4045 RepID=UPI003D79A1A3